MDSVEIFRRTSYVKLSPRDRERCFVPKWRYMYKQYANNKVKCRAMLFSITYCYEKLLQTQLEAPWIVYGLNFRHWTVLRSWRKSSDDVRHFGAKHDATSLRTGLETSCCCTVVTALMMHRKNARGEIPEKKTHTHTHTALRSWHITQTAMWLEEYRSMCTCIMITN